MEQNTAVETAVVETVDNGEALQAMTETLPDTSFERIEKDADVLQVATVTVKQYIADCAVAGVVHPADHIRSEAVSRGLWLAELRGKLESKLSRIGEIASPENKGMGYTNALAQLRSLVKTWENVNDEKHNLYSRLLKIANYANAVNKEMSCQKKDTDVDGLKAKEEKKTSEREEKRQAEKTAAERIAASQIEADFSEQYHNKLFRRFEQIAILVGHCERMTKNQIVSALIEALTPPEQPTGEEVVA